MGAWTQENWRTWVRSDGAVVRWLNLTQYQNPDMNRARMWIAFGPGEEGYLAMGRRGSILRFPIRWKTPEAAIAAVDRAYPLTKT